ncbi:MAG TPA: hypothetical protein VIM86_07690 [Thermodesulfobacteriota bacterium]
MLDHRNDIYIRDGGGDRVKPQHLVVLFTFLVVLYVAGSALLSLLGRI